MKIMQSHSGSHWSDYHTEKTNERHLKITDPRPGNFSYQTDTHFSELYLCAVSVLQNPKVWTDECQEWDSRQGHDTRFKNQLKIVIQTRIHNLELKVLGGDGEAYSRFQVSIYLGSGPVWGQLHRSKGGQWQDRNSDSETKEPNMRLD